MGPHPQFLELPGAHPTPRGLGGAVFFRGVRGLLCSALLSQHRLGGLPFLGIERAAEAELGAPTENF